MRKIASLLSAFVLCLTVSASASYCTYCGKGSPDSANFCSNCGTRLYKQTTNTNVCINGNTTTRNTTTYICPNSSNCNSVVTYSTTTPDYTYTTSSNGCTQIIYTNPAILPPPPVYVPHRTVIYRPEPTFGEILIGGILAHQIHKHGHHHHYHHGPKPGPRPAPVHHRR